MLILPAKSFLAKALCALTALGVVAGGSQAYDLTDERTYTVTVFHLPEQCRTKEFRQTCERFAGFFSTRFDRQAIDLVSERFRQADFENGFDDQEIVGTQEVTLSLRDLMDMGIITMGAEIVAELEGRISRTYESMNFDVEKGRPIAFEEMFADPRLAAMICARKFDAVFGREPTGLFDAVSAAIELGPRNYVLRRDGVELIFAAGTAAKGETPSHLIVSLDELSAAGPKQKFFKSLH